MPLVLELALRGEGENLGPSGLEERWGESWQLATRGPQLASPGGSRPDGQSGDAWAKRMQDLGEPGPV